jgi:hypothetical protein
MDTKKIETCEKKKSRKSWTCQTNARGTSGWRRVSERFRKVRCSSKSTEREGRGWEREQIKREEEEEAEGKPMIQFFFQPKVIHSSFQSKAKSQFRVATSLFFIFIIKKKNNNGINKYAYYILFAAPLQCLIVVLSYLFNLFDNSRRFFLFVFERVLALILCSVSLPRFLFHSWEKRETKTKDEKKIIF